MKLLKAIYKILPFAKFCCKLNFLIIIENSLLYHESNTTNRQCNTSWDFQILCQVLVLRSIQTYSRPIRDISVPCTNKNILQLYIRLFLHFSIYIKTVNNRSVHEISRESKYVNCISCIYVIDVRVYRICI